MNVISSILYGSLMFFLEKNNANPSRLRLQKFSLRLRLQAAALSLSDGSDETSAFRGSWEPRSLFVGELSDSVNHKSQKSVCGCLWVCKYDRTIIAPKKL